MGLISHRIDRSAITSGDHIYTWRSLFSYAHHGIYIGQGMVVHFTQQNQDSSEFSSSRSYGFGLGNLMLSSSIPKPSCICCPNNPDCGFRKPDSGVNLSCLDCFLDNGSLYRFEYEVTRSVYLAKIRGGTCTTEKSDPPDEVILKALYLLQTGFGKYDLVQNNCEDFAFYCKTGLMINDRRAPGTSGQVDFGISASRAVISSLFSSSVAKFVKRAPGTSGQVNFGILTSRAVISSVVSMFVTANPLIHVAVATGTYYANRCVDISVRPNVIKVQLEDVAMFLEKRNW